MALLGLIVTILVAGAIGGIVNAIVSQNGFLRPRTEHTDQGDIWRPGILGNIVVSAIAGLLSYVLYSPAAEVIKLNFGNTPPPAPGTTPPVYSITLPALAGVCLVGVSGARWLTNEVDKRILKAAVEESAGAKSTPEVKAQIRKKSPVEVLDLARTL